METLLFTGPAAGCVPRAREDEPATLFDEWRMPSAFPAPAGMNR